MNSLKTGEAASKNPWRSIAYGIRFSFVVFLGVLTLTSCYHRPYHASRPAPDRIVADAEIPSTQVYFYPKAGQTTAQQSRDHYDCYNWAMKQTGFDPGQSSIPNDQRVRVVPMPPPGHDTATLAIAGAVLGALIGGPRHAAQGALIGATGGVITGAVSDAARYETARQMEEAYNEQDRRRNAQLAEKALLFRRAMSACLEGRAYSVR